MVTLPNKKRRDKTAEEYCISLKALLGRKGQKKTISLDKFKESLTNVSGSV